MLSLSFPNLPACIVATETLKAEFGEPANFETDDHLRDAMGPRLMVSAVRHERALRKRCAMSQTDPKPDV